MCMQGVWRGGPRWRRLKRVRQGRGAAPRWWLLGSPGPPGVGPPPPTLAPAAQRGRMVGTVMTGLLLGILLSRVVSGFVAQQWGWRTVYVAAAVAIALLTVAVWRGLPRFAPTTQMGYGALIGSMVAL